MTYKTHSAMYKTHSVTQNTLSLAQKTLYHRLTQTLSHWATKHPLIYTEHTLKDIKTHLTDRKLTIITKKTPTQNTL